MLKKKIYLVRHGESVANVRKVFAGQKDDSPLTDLGRTQARETAQSLKAMNLEFTKIIASPLSRAKETAEIIKQELNFVGLEITIDERVAEYDMGAITGTPFHEMTSIKMVSAKGAEDPELFSKRVHDLLEDVKTSDGHVLIVSHAGVGRVIVGKKTGIEAKNFYDIPPLKNAEVLEVL